MRIISSLSFWYRCHYLYSDFIKDLCSIVNPLITDPCSLRCPHSLKTFPVDATMTYTRWHTRPSQKDLARVVYPLNNKSLEGWEGSLYSCTLQSRNCDVLHRHLGADTPLKKVREFPVPSRDVTTKLSLGGNNDVITELFLPMGSLVSDIPAGDGKLVNLFLLCSDKSPKLGPPLIFSISLGRTSALVRKG